MITTKPYRPDLLKRLASPEYAAGFLRAVIEDKDEKVFLIALGDIIDAYGGVSVIAKKTGISRQHLYRIVKGEGNPTFLTLNAILEAVGIRLDFTVSDTQAA